VPKTTPSTVLQGNTGGVSLLIGNYPGYLSGGANVTLSGHTGSAGATVAIHAAAGGTGAGAGIALAAGTQTATTYSTGTAMNDNIGGPWHRGMGSWSTAGATSNPDTLAMSRISAGQAYIPMLKFWST